MAERLGNDEVGVVSITRVQAQIMTVDTFINDVQECIKQVEARVGKFEELQRKVDSDLIDTDDLGGLKLFCLNI